MAMKNLQQRNALQEDRYTAGSRILWLWISVDKDARVSNMTDYNTLAQDKGDADY